MTFTAGAVAHALGEDAELVDAICESLDTCRKLLRQGGTETWPGGNIESRYTFRHALFQQAARLRSSSTTVRAYHRKMAEYIAAGHAGRSSEVAAELAMHYEGALVPLEAARHHLAAGDRAAVRQGFRESIVHYEHAGRLLDSVPANREAELCCRSPKSAEQ